MRGNALPGGVQERILNTNKQLYVLLMLTIGCVGESVCRETNSSVCVCVCVCVLICDGELDLISSSGPSTSYEIWIKPCRNRTENRI